MKRREFIKKYIVSAGVLVPFVAPKRVLAPIIIVAPQQYKAIPAGGGGGGSPVTFDSTFEKGASGQTSPFSFVSNAGTVAGTVGSNSNRVLIAYVAFLGITSSAVAITWNSVSMTSITSQLALSSGPYDQYLFGLINPATGNQTLSCSWTGGSTVIALGAASLYNVHQTTAWQNGGSDTGTCSGANCAASTITSAADNMAIAGHLDNNASSLTPGNGTSCWTELALNGNYAMSRRLSTSASTVIDWGLGSSVQWGNVKCDVIKA